MNHDSFSGWRAFLPDLLLLISTLVWGLSFTILKEILGGQISLFFFVFLRFFISAILLLIFFGYRLKKIDIDGVKAGMFLGVLVFAGFVAQTLGLSSTTASKSAFMTGLSAIFVPIFMLLHKRKLPEPLLLVALILATFGMFLLTGPAGGGFNLGDLLTLLCAVVFGGQIYAVSVIAEKHDALGLTTIEIISTAILAATLLPFERIHIELSWGTIGALAFMTLFATVGGLTAQIWAQKRTPAVRAGLIFTAEPVFAYMFASIILSEHFNPLQKAGGVIIILAVLSSEVIPRLLPQRK